MAAKEGPVASGSVTPGTVEETVPARLLDTPDLQRLLRRSTSGACLVRGSAGDRVASRSIYNTEGTSRGDRPRSPGACFGDGQVFYGRLAPVPFPQDVRRAIRGNGPLPLITGRLSCENGARGRPDPSALSSIGRV